MNPSLQIKASITTCIIASLRRNKQKIHQFITGGFFLNVEINKRDFSYREKSQNQYYFSARRVTNMASPKLKKR